MFKKLFLFLVEQLFIFLSLMNHFNSAFYLSLISWETLPALPPPCSWPVPAGAAGPPLRSSGATPAQRLLLSALLPLKQEQKGPKMLREESNDSHYDASIDGGVSVPKSASRAKRLPTSTLGQRCEVQSAFIRGLTDIFECPLWPLHEPLLLQSTSSSYHCWSVPSSLWSWVHGFSPLLTSPRLLAESPAAWPFPVHSHPEKHTTCDVTFRNVLCKACVQLQQV